jgi:hypothetical protein
VNEDSDTIYGYPRMESVCKGGNSHLLNFTSAYAKGCELEEETRVLKKEIDELKQENERLENLTASGIHTCHSECQRPRCVLRRERDTLAAELMKVTAERDVAAKQVGVELAECVALRARVADLEIQRDMDTECIERIRSAGVKAEQRVAELETMLLGARGYTAMPLSTTTDRMQAEIDEQRGRVLQMQESVSAAERRVAELVAVLRRFPPMHADKNSSLWLWVASVELLLARAESDAPAKHPDTEGDVIGEYEGKDGRRYWWTGGVWLYPGQEVAVISTRKQGGSHD